MIRAQVCVVGSGAGGSVAANRLAQAGLDVLLIEEGERHDAASMTQDELEMIRAFSPTMACARVKTPRSW